MGTNRIWRTDNFFNSAALLDGQQSGAAFPERGFNALNYPHTILSIAFVAADRECNSLRLRHQGRRSPAHPRRRPHVDQSGSRQDLAGAADQLARLRPSSPDRLFAAISSYDEETPLTPGHIFRTDNALAASPAWRQVGPARRCAVCECSVQRVGDRSHRLRRVYAGSDNGLWQSGNGGDSWVKVGREAGLPPASIYDIQISAAGRAVIFTYGRGAFELKR